MTTQSQDTSYDPELAERVITLIESKSDAVVFTQLAGAPSSIRAEAIREFLWRGDDRGFQAARDLLLQGSLTPSEIRTVFTTAAELGETRILKVLSRANPEALDAATIRTALLGALHSNQQKSIGWIADTELLPSDVKHAAITPSLFQAATTVNDSIRNELGTAETIITKQYRDARYERRAQQREERVAPKRPSAEELRTLRIERKYSRELRLAVNRIRNSRQAAADSLHGEQLRDHSETTSLLIGQVTRELERQKAIALLKPISTTPRQANKEATLAVLRSSNPEGHENSPSFAEMLGAFFRKRYSNASAGQVNFSDFIDSVLSRWGRDGRPLSREGLCKLIQQKHPAHSTLSNAALYHWKNHPEQTPNTESLTILAQAFNLSKTHELLMYRIAKGTPCHHLERLISSAENALGTPDERKARGQLVRALTDASGIPLINLSQMLGVQQLSLWKRGQRIDDRGMAARFVNLVNPVLIHPKREREHAREVNSRIQAVLGGRPQSIFDAVLLAERSEVANPPGLLFSLLVGRRGINPLTREAVANQLRVTPSKIHHMGSSSERRGGEITESIATNILDYVQGVTAETRHLLSPTQRAERELAIDALTGVPSAVKLLMRVQTGELQRIGDVYRLTRYRRGLSQPSGMSDFELGKASISHPRAAAIANWLGFVGPEHRECRRLFITMATGTASSESPSQILDAIILGRIERHIGVQRLFDWTGLTRRELSTKIGASKGSANVYATDARGGRIYNPKHLRALAAELGLHHRIDEMITVFTPKNYTPTAPAIE